MRVGLDGRPLVGRRTGVGRYVYEICRELDSLLPEAQFFIYAPIPVELPVQSHRWICRVERRAWARALKPIAWLKLRAGRLGREDRLDVFWGTATLLPPLPAGIRTLTTVYDLTFRIAPETMGRTHLMAQRLFFKRDVRRARHRLAISMGTAARLQAWLGGPPAAVAPPAASPVFRPADTETVNRTLSRLGIARPYFLAVGTWEPRKNLELLIQVFRAMQASGEIPGYRLVLAGGAGWKDERLRALLPQDSARAGGDAVLPLGFVADEQLAHLYTGCQAFVFPSRYEGFGLPVLEARACGARVIASDIPEIREAGGNQVLYISPTFDGLREGLSRSITLPRGVPPEPGLLPEWHRTAAIVARYINAD
ncbi:MAG: glycosyltransferase family 4 protein [Gemmatimonadales bacterium]